MRSLSPLLLLLALHALAGCASEPRVGERDPLHVVRFAVMHPPEVAREAPRALDHVRRAVRRLRAGANDLAFVVVPGPLLAKGATVEDLDALVSELEPLRREMPVYVDVASSDIAAVGQEPALIRLRPFGLSERSQLVGPPAGPGVLVLLNGADPAIRSPFLADQTLRFVSIMPAGVRPPGERHVTWTGGPGFSGSTPLAQPGALLMFAVNRSTGEMTPTKVLTPTTLSQACRDPTCGHAPIGPRLRRNR